MVPPTPAAWCGLKKLSKAELEPLSVLQAPEARRGERRKASCLNVSRSFFITARSPLTLTPLAHSAVVWVADSDPDSSPYLHHPQSQSGDQDSEAVGHSVTGHRSQDAVGTRTCNPFLHPSRHALTRHGGEEVGGGQEGLTGQVGAGGRGGAGVVSTAAVGMLVMCG